VNAETAYLFRHAILRDAAYALQPPEERATLHAQALAAMEALFDDTAREPHCADLATHAGQASLQDHARFAALGVVEVTYRLRAALAAMAAYRNEEALSGFRAVFDHPDAQPRQRLKALMESTEIMAYLPRSIEGVALAERAADIALGLRDGPAWLHARKRVTWLRSNNGLLEPALTEQGGLVNAALAEGDDALIAGLLSDMATMQRRAGQYAQAEESFNQALEASKRVGIPRGIGTVELNLGGLHLQRGGRDKAEALFRSAIAHFQKDTPKRILRIAVGNLSVALRQSAPQESEACALRSLELARETGDQQSLGDALSGLASLRHSQGRDDEAEKLFMAALDILREAGENRRASMALGNLGSMLESQGRLDEAEKWYKSALDAAEHYREVHSAAYWNISLAMVAARRNHWPEASARCNNARAEAENAGDPLLSAVYHALVALTLRQQGQQESAVQLWQRATREFEALGDQGATERKALNQMWNSPV